mgnify:CR=1 FL=1
MKIKLVGKNLHDIMPLLSERGFELADTDFDLIIPHGGDGALLGAERDYPGIPKLPIRDDRTAPLCSDHDYVRQLDDFMAGRTRKTIMTKLAGSCENGMVLGLNDIFIHNADRVSAVRYRVWIDDELYVAEVVGDGVGVATVHGSTAYYRSITHSIFRVGIGMAFSNTTEPTTHLVLPEESVIRIEITRGPAIMVADNSHERLKLKNGDFVTICRHVQPATVYGLNNFMCPKCRLLRHPNHNPYLNSQINLLAEKL